VTLVVDDGAGRASFTQHVSVAGEPVRDPVLVLRAPEEPSFRPRPPWQVDVYGRPVRFIPNTLEFVARSSRPVPRAKVVALSNAGAGALAGAGSPQIEYENGRKWLKIAPQGNANAQLLEVAADATGLEPGTYAARVHVDCPGAVNSPQVFRAELRVAADPPKPGTTVDDRDAGFYATPYFWVGHRFCRCAPARRGHGGFYLTNGARPVQGEFARFTPDLRAGRYEVALSQETPFSPEVAFDVRLRHALGDQFVRVEPEQSRVIGTFEFDEGMDGFVEIHAGRSKGLVIADAIVFRPKDGPSQ
jgi:hypothetical protein